MGYGAASLAVAGRAATGAARHPHRHAARHGVHRGPGDGRRRLSASAASGTSSSTGFNNNFYKPMISTGDDRLHRPRAGLRPAAARRRSAGHAVDPSEGGVIMSIWRQAYTWLNDPLNWTNPGRHHRPYGRASLDLGAPRSALAMRGRLADRDLAWPPGSWRRHRRHGCQPHPRRPDGCTADHLPAYRDRVRSAADHSGARRCSPCRRCSPTHTSGVREVDPDITRRRAGHGPVRAADCYAGSSCRSRCRTSPPDSGPRLCRSWRPRRWRRSSTAAGSA